jgi:hypothetical protein
VPKPIYCIVSSGASVDVKSTLISLFTVIERLDLPRAPEITTGEPTLLSGEQQMLFTTCWMREEGDAGKAFAQRIKVIDPDGAEHAMADIRLEFGHNPAKYLGRFTVKLPGLPLSGTATSGLAWFVSEMREEGNEALLAEQRYPVWIAINEPELETADQPSEPTSAE